MVSWIADVQLLLLIVAANAAPVLARRWLPETGNRPVDGGRCWHDGRPIFGTSKTWRGIASGTLAAMCTGLAFGWPWWLGLMLGLGAMAGDLASSFAKRRLGIAPEGKATALDQLPESLFPALLAQLRLPIGLLDAWLVALAFMLLDIAVSPLFYRLGLRKRPY